MLPPLDPDTGLLPVGEHAASWDEVLDRFGWNEKRRGLLDGLADALSLLASAGCRRVWINGSFVTSKDEPADVDVCWDTEGVDVSRGRAAQKERFGCEFLPNVTEASSGLVFAQFFQNKRDGSRKGIVILNLREP